MATDVVLRDDKWTFVFFRHQVKWWGQATDAIYAASLGLANSRVGSITEWLFSCIVECRTLQ